MTRTLGKECRRLIWERGSSKVAEDATISSSLLRVLAIADLRPPGPIHDTVDDIQCRGEAQARKNYRIVIRVRAGPLISLLTPGQGHQARVEYVFRRPKRDRRRRGQGPSGKSRPIQGAQPGR